MAKQPDADKAPEEQPADATPAAPETKPHCGIIMPLSDTIGYDNGHWGQVQSLIIRAAEKAGFTSSMVSTNQAEDMIHTSIVRNIYNNEVVVCDVSSLNANVMLELGLRMATLLPLVIIFDGEKDYPFDIKQMIHERYPKGLHFFKIESFVNSLSEKIKQVYEAQQKKEYQPFLGHFKEVKIEPAKLGSESQSVNEVLQTLVSQMSAVRRDLKGIQNVSNDKVLEKDYARYHPSYSTFEGIHDEEYAVLDNLFKRMSANNSYTTLSATDKNSYLATEIVNALYKNQSRSFKFSRKDAIASYLNNVTQSGRTID